MQLSDSHYLLERYGYFTLFDSSFQQLRSGTPYEDSYDVILSAKGNLVLFAQNGIHYVFHPDGRLQKLSEILPVMDRDITHAILYANRYVIYLTDHSKRISQFDLIENVQRFSIPIHSTRFKHPDDLVPNRILPLIFMNDEKINVLIEYLLPSVDEGS